MEEAGEKDAAPVKRKRECAEPAIVAAEHTSIRGAGGAFGDDSGDSDGASEESEGDGEGKRRKKSRGMRSKLGRTATRESRFKSQQDDVSQLIPETVADRLDESSDGSGDGVLSEGKARKAVERHGGSWVRGKWVSTNKFGKKTKPLSKWAAERGGMQRGRGGGAGGRGGRGFSHRGAPRGGRGGGRTGGATRARATSGH